MVLVTRAHNLELEMTPSDLEKEAVKAAEDKK